MPAHKGTNNGGGRKLSPVHDGQISHEKKYEKLVNAQKDLADIPNTPPKFIPYYGKKLWELIIPQLRQMGMIKKLDEITVIMLCESYDTYRRAYKQLGNEYTVNGRKNPLVNVMNDEKKVMLQCSRELGLTYTSRSAMLPDSNNEETDEIDDDPMSYLKALAGGKQ